MGRGTRKSFGIGSPADSRFERKGLHPVSLMPLAPKRCYLVKFGVKSLKLRYSQTLKAHEGGLFCLSESPAGFGFFPGRMSLSLAVGLSFFRGGCLSNGQFFMVNRIE